MARKVIWSDEAVADLGDLVSHIARDNPAAAERLGRKIFEQTRRLGDFPLAGRVVPEVGEDLVREVIVGTYRVIYELHADDHTLSIVRVWHAARGQPELGG